MKTAIFCATSLKDLRDFPEDARKEAGHWIDGIQRGEEPDDWKPMPPVGDGVREIRIHEASGAFRVFYVAKFEKHIYVLHCFQKKTQKTSKADIELGRKRYRDLINLIKEVAP
jgi:phage-related protein